MVALDEFDHRIECHRLDAFDQRSKTSEALREARVRSPRLHGLETVPRPDADESIRFGAISKERRPACAIDRGPGPLGELVPSGDELVLATRFHNPDAGRIRLAHDQLRPVTDTAVRSIS